MAETKFLTKIYEWRVRAGFVAAVLSLLLADVTPISLSAGLAVALCGLWIRAWACGFLLKEKELATSGPYRHTRNPLYIGNFIIGLGIVVCSNSWWVFVIFFVYFLFFYPVLIHEEKRRMSNLFPDEYKEYSRKVPLIFPTLRPKYPRNLRRFSWRLYRHNKEERALIGTGIYWAMMAAKMIVF
jgi:protein-S-isoprenylcysteine O-methyltransferase Ste14